MKDADCGNLSHEYALFNKVRPLFIALGDADRQDILLHLATQSRLSVNELTSLTKLSRPTVSYHIKVLRDAGLVYQEKDGVKRYYQPTFSRYIQPLKELIHSVEQIEIGGYNGK
jgi:DNA-binding transcriptional ArsR family regulator